MNGLNFFHVGVVDEFCQPVADDAVTQIEIYDAGTNVLATIYTDEAGTTTLTNPATTLVNQGVRFYGGNATYDIVAIGPTGEVRRNSAKPTDVRLQLPIMGKQCGVFPFNAGIQIKRLDITATPTGAEQDTGWDLPAKAVVLGVYIDVRVAEATGGTKTLDVGLLSSESGGDADGLLDGVSVAATGLKKGTLLNTGQTLGALMRQDESGAGVLVPEPHVVATAKSVTYTAGSNDFAEFRGAIYVLYLEAA